MNKKLRLIGLGVASVATVALLSGCTVSSGDPASTAPATSAVDEKFIVGIAGANYAIESARAQYEALAAGLTGTSPAFSNAKARRMLGWRPAHHWRDELPGPSDPQTRKDAPAWTSTASSSSR